MTLLLREFLEEITMNNLYDYAMRRAVVSGALEGLTENEKELYLSELISDIIREQEFSAYTVRCYNGS